MLAVVDLWADGDPDALAMRFASDATYQDMPFAVVHEGRDAIRAYLRQALARMTVEQVVHRISQDGRWVLTERTDIVTIDGERIEIPLMGAVEIVDGLVRTWRDYYQFPRRLGEINL